MTKPKRTLVALLIASVLAASVQVAPSVAEEAVQFGAHVAAMGTFLVDSTLLNPAGVPVITPDRMGPQVGFWSWVGIIASGVALFVRIWCHEDVNEGGNWGC